jgi:hypothetical protein
MGTVLLTYLQKIYTDRFENSTKSGRKRFRIGKFANFTTRSGNRYIEMYQKIS